MWGHTSDSTATGVDIVAFHSRPQAAKAAGVVRHCIDRARRRCSPGSAPPATAPAAHTLVRRWLQPRAVLGKNRGVPVPWAVSSDLADPHFPRHGGRHLFAGGSVHDGRGGGTDRVSATPRCWPPLRETTVWFSAPRRACPPCVSTTPHHTPLS